MFFAATISVRAFQLLSAIVILGFSTTFFTESYTLDLSIFTYSLFVGILSVVTSVFGITAIFVTPISTRLTAVADAFAAIFLFCGGVTWASSLRGWSSCNIYAQSPVARDICRKFYTNEVFMFLGFLLSLALVGLGIQSFKKRKTGPDYVI